MLLRGAPPIVDGMRIALPAMLGPLDERSFATRPAVAVYDVATGKRLSHSMALRFFQRFIEIDPATRIGLAFGPIGKGLRPFSY